MTENTIKDTNPAETHTVSQLSHHVNVHVCIYLCFYLFRFHYAPHRSLPVASLMFEEAI